MQELLGSLGQRTCMASACPGASSPCGQELQFMLFLGAPFPSLLFLAGPWPMPWWTGAARGILTKP